MTRRKDPVTGAPETAPETLAEPMTVDPAPSASPSPAPRHRSGLFGTLTGGALVALGGFALAQFNVLGLRPAPAPDLSAKLAALEMQVLELPSPTADLAALAQRLDAIEARLAVIETTPATDPAALQALNERLTAIESLPEGDAATTAALAARLAKLESALQALPSGDPAAMQAELDAALARLSAAEADAEARAAEATAAAAGASRDQALDALSEAVGSGAPFGPELQALADPALDATLGPMADTGAPTLAALQTAFPDAAREVLRLSRDISAEDGWTDRLVDFLADQTEARSLTPRDGDSPDAILSRAEFALSEGRVADTLAELALLDAAVSAPLIQWTDSANRHLAAMSALAAAKGE